MRANSPTADLIFTNRQTSVYSATDEKSAGLNSLNSQIDRREDNQSTSTAQTDFKTAGLTANDKKSITFEIPQARRHNPQSIATFSPMQEWEGYVTEVKDETFTAHLVDITAKRRIAEEKIEISISDLSDQDKDLLREGALFRWSIGYYKQHGTKMKSSRIVFRRLPAWTKSDFMKAEQKAKELIGAITWE
jgi:hypothetical protein